MTAANKTLSVDELARKKIEERYEKLREFYKAHQDLEWKYIDEISSKLNRIQPRDHFVVSVTETKEKLEKGCVIENGCNMPRVVWGMFEKSKSKKGLQCRDYISINKDKIDQDKLFEILVDRIRYIDGNDAFYNIWFLENKFEKRPNYCLTFAFGKDILNIDDFIKHAQRAYPRYESFSVDKIENAVTFFTNPRNKGDLK